MVKCLAFDCQHYRESKKCTFFPLPINASVRKIWISLLRLKHDTNKRYAVCNCHFKDGLKCNLPEYFLRNINKHFDCFPAVGPQTRSRQNKNVRIPIEITDIAKIRALLSRVDVKPKICKYKNTKTLATPNLAIKQLEPNSLVSNEENVTPTSYNTIKQNDSIIDEESHIENVQVSNFVEPPSHTQITIDDTPDTTLIQMLNSTPAQITAILQLNPDANQTLYNFKNTCRICLKDNPSRNIYEDHIENINIVDMLQQITSSKISEMDKLPKLVCTNCVQQIFYAYKFLIKYVTSNKKLVEYVQFCEAHVKTITDLNQSIHFDHCYNSSRTPQLPAPEYTHVSDSNVLETDPLAIESPSFSPENEHFQDESNTKYLPVIPAGFINCYPERSKLSNIPDIPSISADFPSYMINISDVDAIESTNDLETSSNNIDCNYPDVAPGQSLLKNVRKDDIPVSGNDDKIEKPMIISAEVNQTVESFKTVLKSTSDIDDHMKVDIIDTLIQLYSLKIPETDTNVDSKKIFNCKRCNKIFAGRKEKKKHNCANPILRNVKLVYTNPEKRDQIESFQCRICRQRFSNLTVLVSHSCFVKFTRKRAQKSEKPLSKQFTCYECSEKFDFYSELVKHRADTSHADGIVLTDKPVEISVSTTDLNEINAAVHSIDPECELTPAEQPVAENFKHLCRKCEQRFEFFSQLVQHNRSCKPPPILTCSVCSLEMKRAKITEHMKMHNNERTYCCEFCGRSFKFGRHFKRHMEIHLDIKPYDCSECGKKFRQKSALKTHSLIHSGEKPYMCEGCGQKFRQRGTLTVHLKTKPCGKTLELDVDKSKYACSVCLKQYTSKSQLIVHLKSHAYLK